ncbi:hypothetical protein ABT299_15875 [Spirillospora sp. NPDC000708]
MFREFLYLDGNLTDQFLAQIEGGLAAERRIKQTGTRKGGFGGDLGGGIGPAKVNVKADKSSEKAIEEEQTRLDTTPARYDRLESAMMEMHQEGNPYGLNELTDISEQTFNELTSGTIIALTCDLEISQISSLLSRSGGLAGFMELAATMGADVTDEDRRQANQIAALTTGDESTLIAQGYLDDDQPVLALPLKSSWILGDIEGDARVVGKISGKWPKGEYRPLFDLPGGTIMNRRQRKALAKQIARENPDDNDMLLGGPGITLSVLAIYR